MDARGQSRIAEATEAATYASMVDIAGPEVRSAIGLECRRIGSGLAVRMAAAPDVPVFTRAFGFDEPPTAAELDEAVDYLRAAGGSAVLLQLSPHLETPDVLALLEERGLTRGHTWAKMIRPIGPAPAVATDLRIERVGPDRADEFADVLLTGMQMPAVMAPFAAAQVTAPGWTAYAAFDGDRIVATGSLFRSGDAGQLAGAATLPSHRGRGAQLALMAVRIDEAARLGARWITAETGSETPDDPNPSLHNMRRAGLEELYARQNWVLRLPPTGSAVR